MGEVVCHHCGTLIDPQERCESVCGVARCMESAGHKGWHWSDVGAAPAVLVWTGIFAKRSCPGRLDLSRWCQKPAGHEGAHNDGRGTSFSDPEPVHNGGPTDA